MRISFDLDDTLICRHAAALAERTWLPRLLRGFSGEPLRHGTRALFRELRGLGCEIWIYTSSLRSPLGLRLWLLSYGVRVDGVVNDDIHRQALAGLAFKRLPSKYPPAFGIDLHVDDSEGVKLEGEEHGFRVVVIKPEDETWVERILSTL